MSNFTQKIFEKLTEDSLGFTKVFGALGGLLAWIAWGTGVIAQPQFPLLIYGFAFATFSGIGGAIDYYQSKYLESDDS